MTDAPIQWPLCVPKARGGRHSIVVYRDLLKALKLESNIAIAKAWGVTSQTVCIWRKALGVKHTAGTIRLRQEYADEPWSVAARQKAWKGTGDPERRAKQSAAHKGRKKSPEYIAKMAASLRGRKLPPETREKLRTAALARGANPQTAGRRWTAAEDQAVRKLPIDAAVLATGRTADAVRARRRKLGVT